ncbi:MAG: helix-turn-helix domain-containing protein [Ruminococcaceae bacterium]|nr:helix-turn-helix domain-containing protein [Oscillospiraceae bacterium]
MTIPTDKFINMTGNITGVTDHPFVVTHTHTTGHKMPYLHWHSHYEMLIIPHGKVELINNNTRIKSAKPLAVIHCPYTLHNMNADESSVYERYMITFAKETIRKFTPETLNLHPLHQASLVYAEPDKSEIEELSDYSERLKTYIRNDETMSALLIAAILRRIVMICESGRGEIVQTNISYIQNVLNYISDNIHQPITAADLAAMNDVGLTKFHADFKSTVGKTYKQHLTDLRQTYARQLLESGESIINTSIECGYSSESHFIKAFREYWGITPGEFVHSGLTEKSR